MDNVTIARGNRIMRAPTRKVYTTMKKIKMNEYRINHENSTISCGKTFMKKAGVYGSAEYNVLVGLKQDFPDYRIITVVPARAEERMSMRGLTCEFMEHHIARLYGEDSVAYKTFREQLAYSEAYKNPYMYMRKWFVENYPDWDGKEARRQEKRVQKAAERIHLAEESIAHIQEVAS